MTNRLLAAGFWIGLAFFGGHAVTAQTSSNAASTVVDEAKARATLVGDSIRFQLPLTTPAVAGERAVVWLLSPLNAVSSETSVARREGSRSVVVTLPWAKDARSSENQEVGWYRIAYRIEKGGAPIAHGILSVGAIATNLLAMRLARPEILTAGKPLGVRVYAGNPFTHEPYRGVHLQASLVLAPQDTDDKTEESKPKEQSIIRTATTGALGEAVFNFPIKAQPGQSVTLTVVGTLSGPRAIDSGNPGIASAQAHATIKVDSVFGDRTILQIETDKPLHKPGETVHLRALVFDDSGHAAANKALNLTIKDPEYKTLFKTPLTTNRFGIAAYDWKTIPQLATGNYELTLGAENSGYGGSAIETIRIQRYELPEFAVSVAMDRGYYLEGQAPVAHIHAGYLFGKSVADGKVRIIRADEQTWNPKTGKFDEPRQVEQNSKLDANGDADLHLDVKEDFADFEDREGERYDDVQYRAIVTDSTTGRSEPRNFTVRLTRYPVHIYLRELDGNEHEGDYIVSTSYADGVPAACGVKLDWMDGEAVRGSAATAATNHYGVARVHLRYPAWTEEKDQNGTLPSVGIRLTATDRKGSTSIFDDTESLDHAEISDSARNIWISVAHTLLKPGQPIEAALHGPVGSTIDVEVLSDDGVLAQLQVRMRHAEEPLTIAANTAFHGLIGLQAYSMNSDEEGYRWHRSTGYKAVLYPEDRELKLKLTGLQPSYLPGAEVEAGLAIHDASGSAAPGALGVAVIDTAVEQRAETEEEANEHWYGW
jgi:hypothetical protein